MNKRKDELKMIIRRGEIYHISRSMNGNVIGSEQEADRPAIIVSNNKGNEFSNCVEIVYLTSQAKKPMPTHVEIECSVPSTALCEQVYTVSKERLKEYIKRCSDEEMERIDKALMISLGIDTGAINEKEPESTMSIPIKPEQAIEVIKVEQERNIYKDLYEKLLEKMIG